MNTSSKTRIQFKQLVTMTGEEFHNGELFVEDGNVTAIQNGFSNSFDGRTLDWKDHLVLPGFVNAHCHLALSALHSKIPKVDAFTDWIVNVVVENAALSWSERVDAMHQQAGVLLQSGVTTLADYASHPEMLVEYAALPFRQILFLEVLGFQEKDADTVAGKVRGLLEEHAGSGKNFKLGVAPHAPYSVSPALFKKLKDLAKHFSCPLSCHVAEVPEENEFLKTGGGDLSTLLKQRGVYDEGWTPPGKAAIPYLADLGVLDSMVAVHLNEAGPDLNLLVEYGVSAIFCPGSTRWFDRNRWMPVQQLLDVGVPVGLGTDSLASNNSLNFLDEIRLAEEMLPDVTRIQILEMATREGARALNFEAGTVEAGRPADLIGFRIPNKLTQWFDIPFEKERLSVDRILIRGEAPNPNPAPGLHL